MKNTKKKIKNYAQKISQKKRFELLAVVDRAIDKHEKLKGAYFYTPPSAASMRRNYEKYHSIYVSFKYDGDLYEYQSSVTCSCRNVYYDHSFSINNKYVTVRKFKKVRDELIAAIKAYNEKNKVA